MKTLKFNTKSWHYQLATKIANYNPGYNDEDLCTYTRHVLGALLILMVGVAGVAIVGLLASHMILGIIFSIMYKTFMFTEFGVIGLILSTIILLMFSVIYTTKYLERRKAAKYRGGYVPKPDNFIKHAYKSWKDKFCVKIDFVGEDGKKPESVYTEWDRL